MEKELDREIRSQDLAAITFCYNHPCFSRQRDCRMSRHLRKAIRVSPKDSQGRQAKCGQVAQVVERSPEKAGVGGSTPSLATTFQSS
jgi:hypothetical protein